MNLIEEVYSLVSKNQFLARNWTIDDEASDAFSSLYNTLLTLSKLRKNKDIFSLEGGELIFLSPTAEQFLASLQTKLQYARLLFEKSHFDPRLQAFWDAWTYISGIDGEGTVDLFNRYVSPSENMENRVLRMNKFGRLMASELSNPALKVAAGRRERLYRSRFDRLYKQLCTFERSYRNSQWLSFTFWMQMESGHNALLQIESACEVVRCTIASAAKHGAHCVLIRPVQQRDGVVRLDVAWSQPELSFSQRFIEAKWVMESCEATSKSAMKGEFFPKPRSEYETYRIHADELDLGPTEALRRLAVYYAMADLPCSNFTINADLIFHVGRVAQLPPSKSDDIWPFAKS